MRLVLADVQQDALDETFAEVSAAGAQARRAESMSRRARKSTHWPAPRSTPSVVCSVFSHPHTL
ncbi:hypothetical protein PQR70_30010 [Paraburkholderia madseniana]|uniref:Uncharacterized protein n=1 Tax=Paraburkholderia madseniana TaxID=2599607 RepID=A0AAP5BG44_9BURK|nr:MULTISPECIES: hypothetical protein [Paraburkholderia]MCX4148038.1 hypothetical protein [Paraburkholderia madseniana]MDN7150977.1 hypothetical protein [Paraburkholderia sp. WS6]MDQ6409857.1 hypothetical protein [Paraburkholderia madseniana]